MQEFFKTFVNTYNVFVKSIDGKWQYGKAFKVSNLLQLHVGERSFVQEKSRLIFSKLNCQACEKRPNFLVKVHTLNNSKTRLSLRLQTLIARFWSKLKLDCITFPCLIPIATHAYFGKKKCHLCLRLPFLQWNFHCIDICVTSCGHYYQPSCLSLQCAFSMKCKVERWNEEFDPSWQLTFGFFNIQDEKKSPLQLEVGLLGFLVTNPWSCLILLFVAFVKKKIVLDNHMLCISTKTKLNLFSRWSMKSFWCEEVVALS
jgi:hypothetical protein